MGIHNYARRLQLAIKKVDREGFPDKDKEAIKQSASYLQAQNLNLGRVAKHVFHLITLRRHMKCRFDEATKKDIEELMAWLNTSEYSPYTKKDMKGALKRFFKWLKYGSMSNDVPDPPETGWIRGCGLKI